MKLAIVDWFGYNLSPQERMSLIKEAGFFGVLLWIDYFDKDYKKFPEYARKAGLFVENVHAPYLNANSLWEDNSDGQSYFDEIKNVWKIARIILFRLWLCTLKTKKETKQLNCPIIFRSEQKE